MNVYPYPSLQSLLKFLCAADEYLSLMQNKSLKSQDWISRYVSILPRYTYARCPICNAEYSELIDTYSLSEWDGIENDLDDTLGDARFYYGRNRDLPDPCSHLLGVHAFLNLHGRLPREMEDISSQTGEVPYVTPKLLKRRIRAYAVLHALPICRVEGNEFLPSYTLFCLTYFSEDPQALRELISRSEAEADTGPYDPEYYGSFVAFPGEDAVPHQYDLEYWTIRGWLGWLDFTRPELPLRIGRELQLPDIYRDIDGARQAYFWGFGQIHYQ